jgi:hypothetical protein
MCESALKISFELKRQKNRPGLWKREILRRPVVAYKTINLEVGLLRMTYFNTWSAFSKLELLYKRFVIPDGAKRRTGIVKVSEPLDSGLRLAFAGMMKKNLSIESGDQPGCFHFSGLCRNDDIKRSITVGQVLVRT